jgi:hypothetical protein
VGSLLAAVPEIRQRYDALQEDIGPDVLPFPVFELVLEPFVKGALKSKADTDLLRRVFAFIDEMACASDIEVVNLLHVGIFESWVAEPETLRLAWKYMGKATRQVATDVAHQLHRGENLPREALQ